MIYCPVTLPMIRTTGFFSSWNHVLSTRKRSFILTALDGFAVSSLNLSAIVSGRASPLHSAASTIYFSKSPGKFACVVKTFIFKIPKVLKYDNILRHECFIKRMNCRGLSVQHWPDDYKNNPASTSFFVSSAYPGEIHHVMFFRYTSIRGKEIIRIILFFLTQFSM